MSKRNSHPARQELFLSAEGELPIHRAARVRLHLAVCEICRARIFEMKRKTIEIQQVYRQMMDSMLPPVSKSCAQLKARFAELERQPSTGLWRSLLQLNHTTLTVGYLCMAIVVIGVGGRLLYPVILHRQNPQSSAVLQDVIPNRTLTPGVARQAAISDVCSMPHEEVARAVPSALRQEVLHEYGISSARANEYEIDYLVTPGLGGLENIRNLWPQPYKTQQWNAHDKDALEEHLHQLVCSGQLDMRTAQRDISSNWIAAYQKYFHTDRPLSADSGDAHQQGASVAPKLPVSILRMKALDGQPS